MALKWLQKGPKMLNLPGRCPWTPLRGGLRTPPDPQFIRRRLRPSATGRRVRGKAANRRAVAAPKKKFHKFLFFTP